MMVDVNANAKIISAIGSITAIAVANNVNLIKLSMLITVQDCSQVVNIV